MIRVGGQFSCILVRPTAIGLAGFWTSAAQKIVDPEMGHFCPPPRWGQNLVDQKKLRHLIERQKFSKLGGCNPIHAHYTNFWGENRHDFFDDCAQDVHCTYTGPKIQHIICIFDRGLQCNRNWVTILLKKSKNYNFIEISKKSKLPFSVDIRKTNKTRWFKHIRFKRFSKNSLFHVASWC